MQCFWINLPTGGVALLAIWGLLDSVPPLGVSSSVSIRERIRQTVNMDWIGATLCFASVTCLVLALQWGGNTRPWNDGGVIACIVLAVVLALALVFHQRRMGACAMVPPAVFKNL